MKKLVWRTLIFCTLTLGACNNNGDVVDFLCGDAVLIDRELYDVTTSSDYVITNVTVSDFFITIDMWASGCDGNRMSACLVDSGDVALSLPPMRAIKLAHTNNEDCLAVIERSYTFDLRPILTNESETIILTLDGWGDQIVING